MNSNKLTTFFSLIYKHIRNIEDVVCVAYMLGFRQFSTSRLREETWKNISRTNPEEFMKTLLELLFIIQKNYNLDIIKQEYLGVIEAPLLSPVGILLGCFDNVCLRTLVQHNFKQYMDETKLKEDHKELCQEFSPNFYIIITILEVTEKTIKCDLHISLAYSSVPHNIYYYDSSDCIFKFLQIPPSVTNKEDDVKVTTALKTALLPHQVDALQKMFNHGVFYKGKFYRLYGKVISYKYYYQYNYDEIIPLSKVDKEVSGGLVVMPTGSGKTLVILTYTHSLPNSSVIVVPDLLIQHYKTEVEKHFGNDPRFIYSSGNFDRCDRILITTYSDLHRRYSGIHTYNLIVDEMHLIKNKKSKFYSTLKNIKRHVTWLVSATPDINKVVITELLQLGKFNKTYEPSNAIIIDAKPSIEFKVNIQKVYYEDDKLREIMKVVKCTNPYTVNAQKVIRILEHVFYEQNKIDNIDVYKSMINPVIARVLHVQPVEALEKAFGTSVDICPVCVTEFVEPIQLSCNHVFCYQCLCTLYSMELRSCPSCRARIDFDRLYRANFSGKRSHETKVNRIITSAKYMCFKSELDKWIRESKPNAKLVINLDSEDILDQIWPDISEFTLVTKHFDTNGKKSAKNIEMFKHDPKYRILILHSKYSSGFDLYTASDLWVYTPVTKKNVINQTKGRITRISQIHSEINFKVFVMKGGFDEFLWDYHDHDYLKSSMAVSYVCTLHMYLNHKVFYDMYTELKKYVNEALHLPWHSRDKCISRKVYFHKCIYWKEDVLYVSSKLLKRNFISSYFPVKKIK